MIATVLGSSGFIGRHLVAHLREIGVSVRAMARGDKISGNLGHTFYCIGMTANFRTKPLETMTAHVTEVVNILQEANFDSFLYLSSTRVYQGLDTAKEDGSSLRVNPNHESDLYNISKLAGEALCFADARPAVRVVRLANVYGVDVHSSNFLASLIRDAITQRHLRLSLCNGSTKDYIAVEDVVANLWKIGSRGRHKIYNLACGKNTSNIEIIQRLQECTGCTAEVIANAPEIRFPQISIQRLSDEFGHSPRHLTDDLAALVSAYRSAMEAP